MFNETFVVSRKTDHGQIFSRPHPYLRCGSTFVECRSGSWIRISLRADLDPDAYPESEKLVGIKKWHTKFTMKAPVLDFVFVSSDFSEY